MGQVLSDNFRLPSDPPMFHTDSPPFPLGLESGRRATGVLVHPILVLSPLDSEDGDEEGLDVKVPNPPTELSPELSPGLGNISRGALNQFFRTFFLDIKGLLSSWDGKVTSVD